MKICKKTWMYWISLVTMLLLAKYACSQSPLGIGTNEVAMRPVGPLAHIINWINTEQRDFYLAMTQRLKGMRTDPWQASILVGLSFIYGIFHAAGPGHGKTVISSYMMANKIALKRGLLLSFISSLLQATAAIVVVSLAWVILHAIGISISDTTHSMEIASFALIVILGLWLLWRKVSLLLVTRRRIISLQENIGFEPDAICKACHHAHIPNAAQLLEEFDWKSAWSAILAVALRPCSGALIILTFAILNGLILGGVISVFAMALGTFITVSALATMAVSAKNIVLKFTNTHIRAMRVQAIIEIGAALFIVAIGTIFLITALKL